MFWSTIESPYFVSICSETIDFYSREVRKLCKNLLKYIAISLGLRQNVFAEMFGVAVQAIRMNYYPPCSRPDLVLGLSPHSDGSALTVLQQGKGNSVGLQILKDNSWVPVKPIPHALVINIGDTIEVRDLKYLYVASLFTVNTYWGISDFPKFSGSYKW